MDVAHTPTVPAQDDRPLRLLERTPVADPHKRRLIQVVKTAQEAADGDAEELQSEFGKEHVALIVGCNQFVRLFRAGADPGAVELLLDDGDKEELEAAGFTLGEPEGQIFRMFGWVRVDPTEASDGPLYHAVKAAYRRAKQA